MNGSHAGCDSELTAPILNCKCNGEGLGRREREDSKWFESLDTQRPPSQGYIS